MNLLIDLIAVQLCISYSLHSHLNRINFFNRRIALHMAKPAA